MLNSPSNPTGSVYTRDELTALADVMLGTDATILSDEIYEQLTYGNAKPTCVATLRPELRERTITISGASKSYAMTGWRMGWTIAPKPLIDAMGNMQSQETSCPSSVSQYALLAALDGPQDCVAEMRREFLARRDLVCESLRRIPGITFPTPEGAFYVFFDVSPISASPSAARPSTIHSPSAKPAWKRPTSISCPARPSAPKATSACRTPIAARNWKAVSRHSRSGWGSEPPPRFGEGVRGISVNLNQLGHCGPVCKP